MELEIRTLVVPFIENADEADETIFARGASAPIDQFPWGNEHGYTGRACAYIAYSRDALHVGYRVWEKIVKTTYTQPNDPVSYDSAVEFFFRPHADAVKPYINLEFNSIGTMLAKFSQKLGDFVYVDRSDDSRFNIRAQYSADTIGDYAGDGWQLSFRVPFDVIREHFPTATFRKGDVIRANFHKCGHATAAPHFMVWSNIDLPEPEFHAPTTFAALQLG